MYAAMALDACREMILERVGACTLATSKCKRTDIKADTIVMNAITHEGIPTHQHTLQLPAVVPGAHALSGLPMHVVLTAFRHAAEQLRMSIRFDWARIGDVACVLVIWRLKGFKTNAHATGLLDNMMYELSPLARFKTKLRKLLGTWRILLIGKELGLGLGLGLSPV